ncbi:TIGR02301 family protein [Stappia sp. F7233]|uniref:TIGR02301 family protein n=1 Tax=Stappia albiluteola TaxID=2758565 RepID=A0A839AK42_9HYPH|nr:TIGR02301 family protein [Stappia albiluteola]MBA5779262.1 TIGR02301 family protein [Stappia albiluteola]
MIRLPAAVSRHLVFACLKALLGAALALSVGAASLSAQEQPEDPPYEQDLMRLSEILGALHYLRPLCGHPDGSLWRDEMQALLEAEVQDDSRKRRFIERFNQGYRGFSSVYRDCTPAAELTLSRYVSEAGSIVRNVTTRYNR